MVKIYRTKIAKIAGKDFKSVNSRVSEYYKKIKRKSKRRPYLRSAYFKKDKVFLEVLATSFLKENWNRRSEILHRFSGYTLEEDLFHVQIKEDKKTSQKWLVSIFPDK